MKVAPKTEIGNRAEQMACQYLSEKGLQFIAQNYRGRRGEIDLIMRDDECIVFIEVRFRATSNYGTACESINLKKQSNVIRTAMQFLQQKKCHHAPFRFDIIGITQNKIDWIKNAFSADMYA